MGFRASRYLENRFTVDRRRAGYPRVQVPTAGRLRLEGRIAQGRNPKQATLECLMRLQRATALVGT